jgi:hypothetical protein
VQFPTKADGGIDALEALKLLATGLDFLVNTLHQHQVAPEKTRIILAPALPKEFLLKGKLRAD